MLASQLVLALVALFIYSGADSYGNDRTRMLALAACFAAPLMCSCISEIFLPAFFFVTADANLKSAKALVHHIYTLYNAPPPFWPSVGGISIWIPILWLISLGKRSKFTDHSDAITPKPLPADHKSKQILLETSPPEQKFTISYPTLPKPPKIRPSEPVLKTSKPCESRPRRTYIQRLKDQIGDVPPYPRRFCTRWEEERFLEDVLKRRLNQKNGNEATVVEKHTATPVRAPEKRYRSSDLPVQPQNAAEKPEQAQITHLAENTSDEGSHITTAATTPDTISEMEHAIPGPPSQFQDVGELPAQAESINLAHPKGGDATADGATTCTTQVRAPEIEYRSLDLRFEPEDAAKQPEQVEISDLTGENANEGSEIAATTSIPDMPVGDAYIQPVEPEYTQLGPLFTTWRQVAILQHAGSNEAAAENTITTIADRCSEMEYSIPPDGMGDLVTMMGKLSLGTVLKNSAEDGAEAPSPELLHSGSPTGDEGQPHSGFPTPPEAEHDPTGPEGEIPGSMVVDDAASEADSDSEMNSCDGESSEQASESEDGSDPDEQMKEPTDFDLLEAKYAGSAGGDSQQQQSGSAVGEEMDETENNVPEDKDIPMGDHSSSQSLLDTSQSTGPDLLPNSIVPSGPSEINPYSKNLPSSHDSWSSDLSWLSRYRASRLGSNQPSPFSLPTSRPLRDIKPTSPGPIGQRKYPTIQEILNKSSKGTSPATGAADSDLLGPPQPTSPPKSSAGAPGGSKRVRSEGDVQSDSGDEDDESDGNEVAGDDLTPAVKRGRVGDGTASLRRGLYARDPMYPSKDYWPLKTMSRALAGVQIQQWVKRGFEPVGELASRWEQLKEQYGDGPAWDMFVPIFTNEDTMDQLKTIYHRMHQINDFGLTSIPIAKELKKKYHAFEDGLDELTNVFDDEYKIFTLIADEFLKFTGEK